MSLKDLKLKLLIFGLLALIVTLTGWMVRWSAIVRPDQKEIVAAALLEDFGCSVIREERYLWFNNFLPKQMQANGTKVVVGVDIPVESNIPNYSKRVTKQLEELAYLESISLTGSIMSLAPASQGMSRIDWRDIESLNVVVILKID